MQQPPRTVSEPPASQLLRQGQASVRAVVLAAVLSAWVVVAVVAVFAPALLMLTAALAVLYSIGAPFQLRFLCAELERRLRSPVAVAFLDGQSPR